MTVFLRLLEQKSKDVALDLCVDAFRSGVQESRIFLCDPDAFRAIPGAPFAYWASARALAAFQKLPRFAQSDRVAVRTNGTTDDARWIRTWWEPKVGREKFDTVWITHAKGGAFSPFFSDIYLVIHWDKKRETYPGYTGTNHRPDIRPASLQYFFEPGLTWSRRNSTGLSFRALPQGAIFGDKGPGVFFRGFSPDRALSICAVLNSSTFRYLVSLQLGRFELAQSYEAGIIQNTPMPVLDVELAARLAALAKEAWCLMRTLKEDDETSHVFVLPRALLDRSEEIVFGKLELIQGEIDAACLKAYGLEDDDLSTIRPEAGAPGPGGNDDEEDAGLNNPIDDLPALLSWCVGVAFGRFDWRLTTGERGAPAAPDPFDPLPAKSAGMLPDAAVPFHAHPGILVDDSGHPHDLSRLIEDVLTRVDHPAPEDVRRWLQRDFFPFHLKQYSKSRRKAPIYWPLSTVAGGYTLWLYYPALTDQTLYTAANDFVGPKLEDTSRLVAALRTRTHRSRDEERQFEQLQDLEAELKELRDELLRLAPTWKPNHDDGVQITAAPLWRLFRHRPWQTVLRETWEKLERGDYDWAHLAMTYWPASVCEKCRTDKSLAIAHDLERLYEPPPEKPAAGRGGRKRAVEAS